MVVAQDTHVFLVQAKSSPLKSASLLREQHSDLTCCWGMNGSYSPGVYLEENDYYRSKVDLHHKETGQTIPAGSYFVLADVVDSSYVSEGSSIDPDFPESFAGKRVGMETLDPRDSTQRITFTYWSHDEPARSRFEKVTNQMVLIAIAATGL